MARAFCKAVSQEMDNRPRTGSKTSINVVGISHAHYKKSNSAEYAGEPEPRLRSFVASVFQMGKSF